MSGVEAVKTKQARGDSATGDEVAAYAFDMLQSLRKTCSNDEHRFLSYLMGMAADEAVRLAEGQPSAAAAFSKRRKPRGAAK